MKILNLLFLSVCLAVFPVTSGMTCKPSEQRITYNSLYGVGTGVNSAYAAYMDQTVAGKATFSPNVGKAYNDFQSAFNVAVVAASNNPQAIAPQNVVDLANAVYAAIKQFQK